MSCLEAMYSLKDVGDRWVSVSPVVEGIADGLVVAPAKKAALEAKRRSRAQCELSCQSFQPLYVNGALSIWSSSSPRLRKSPYSNLAGNNHGKTRGVGGCIGKDPKILSGAKDALQVSADSGRG